MPTLGMDGLYFDNHDGHGNLGGLDHYNGLGNFGGGASPPVYARPTTITSALFTSRDGIVGTLKTEELNVPRDTNVHDSAAMHIWSPRVRSLVIDADLLSRVRMMADPTKVKNGKRLSSILEQSRSFKIYDSDRFGERVLGGRDQSENAPPHNPGQIFKMHRPSHGYLADAQLPHVFAYADLRSDRAHEIVAQLGSSVPFFTEIVRLHPDRTRFTIELIMAMLRLVVTTEMWFKHAASVARPADFSPQINPMITTPSHSTIPSGHATEAFAVAHLLAELVRDHVSNAAEIREQLMRQAARVAVNRVVAGVHFPVDGAAGQVLGMCMAEYFLARCKACGGVFTSGWKFLPEEFGERDHDWREIVDRFDSRETNEFMRTRRDFQIDPEPAHTDSGPLNWLYEQACKEWSHTSPLGLEEG